MVFDRQGNTRISRIARPAFLRHYPLMTATLEQIHEDPGILDRAIFQREALDIIANGVVAATVTPSAQLNALDAKRLWVGSLGQVAKSDEHSMDAIRASIATKRGAL